VPVLGAGANFEGAWALIIIAAIAAGLTISALGHAGRVRAAAPARAEARA
jgi:hypothetical protein